MSPICYRTLFPPPFPPPARRSDTHIVFSTTDLPYHSCLKAVEAGMLDFYKDPVVAGITEMADAVLQTPSITSATSQCTLRDRSNPQASTPSADDMRTQLRKNAGKAALE
eukprot:1807444-Rhodomonas_salina.1